MVVTKMYKYRNTIMLNLSFFYRYIISLFYTLLFKANLLFIIIIHILYIINIMNILANYLLVSFNYHIHNYELYFLLIQIINLPGLVI